MVAYAAFVAIALLAGLWILTDINTRSRAYAQFINAWYAKWPLFRGKNLPGRAAPLLSALNLARPIRVEVEPGISLLLDPVDFVDRAILTSGAWEDSLWEWIGSHLEPGATLVDVGAHIGTHSLRAAKKVGATGSVVAIEPNPLTAARLRDNIAASNLRNIRVYETACAESPGRLRLFLGGRVNTGVASLSIKNATASGGTGTDSFEVEVLPLDEIISRLAPTRVDVIKVDTEGAEVRVLRGARETLRKYRPVLVLEVTESLLKNMGSSVAELETLLHESGYKKGRSDPGNEEWIPNP